MSYALELTGRRALVTGGTKGIGAAVVQALHEAGAKVVATARSMPAQPIDGVRYLAADLSTAAGCATVAGAALKHLGGIDIIVDVLGGSAAPAGGFAALDNEAWWNELNRNLLTVARRKRAPARKAAGRSSCRGWAAFLSAGQPSPRKSPTSSPFSFRRAPLP